MSCPTCDHTMQLAARDETGCKVYWCPRCGTLKLETAVNNPSAMSAAALDSGAASELFTNAHVPKLVERCRHFEENLSLDNCDEIPPCIDDWNRLGIAESIHPPDRRPT